MNLRVDERFFLALFCLTDLLVSMTSCHRYHSISQNGKPNKTPFRSFTSRFQQQCVSICGTSCKCHSFTVEMKGQHEWECHFYDTATMREDLVHTEGVVYNIEIRDCKDLYNVGARSTGVYEVNWMGRMKKNVRCNMELDGGGWTVFQRRYKPLVEDFNLDWNSYKQGFGDVYREFWLGNDLIHEATGGGSKPHYVLVFARKEDGKTGISKYGSFYIENDSQLYRLHFNETLLAGFKHSLSRESNPDHKLDGMSFTTPDRDNDLHHVNCADSRGSFWFNSCADILPNNQDQIRWGTFEAGSIVLEMEIMIKAME